MGTALLEPAVSGDIDPRQRAYEIREVRDAVQSGADAAVGNQRVIREVIRRDWDTMLRQGVNPSGMTPRFLDLRELESLQQDRDLALTRRLLVQQLGLVSNSDFMITVCDGNGRVVWTGGNPKVRNEADRFGFIPGALWREMGTNGIRLVTEFLLRGVQVYGPEHWLNPQVRWTCTAAGVYYPRTRPGSPVAVINVMGPWLKVHAHTLGWLCLIARCIEEELRTTTHRSQWRPLVEAARPLDQIGCPALVIDSCGVVVAAHEWDLQPGDRVILPRAGSIAPGRSSARSR
jgi:transcriptional regulator of acetoin/glycerol metabolism